MGDNFEVVVDVEAALGEAPELADTVLHWLVAEGVVDAAQSEAALGTDRGVSDPTGQQSRSGSAHFWTPILSASPGRPGARGTSRRPGEEFELVDRLRSLCSVERG